MGDTGGKLEREKRGYRTSFLLSAPVSVLQHQGTTPYGTPSTSCTMSPQFEHQLCEGHSSTSLNSGNPVSSLWFLQSQGWPAASLGY